MKRNKSGIANTNLGCLDSSILPPPPFLSSISSPFSSQKMGRALIGDGHISATASHSSSTTYVRRRIGRAAAGVYVCWVAAASASSSSGRIGISDRGLRRIGAAAAAAWPDRSHPSGENN